MAALEAYFGNTCEEGNNTSNVLINFMYMVLTRAAVAPLKVKPAAALPTRKAKPVAWLVSSSS